MIVREGLRDASGLLHSRQGHVGLQSRKPSEEKNHGVLEPGGIDLRVPALQTRIAKEES